MLGRKVGSSLTRLPIYTRLPFRPAALQCQSDVTARNFIALSHRSYASVGRPRTAVGEPSRPVKRAVKRKAKEPSGNDEATKQLKTKKKVAAAKKKPAKKTAKAKPKPKKVLTEAQKETAKLRLAKTKLADLKKAALNPPSYRAVTAYNVFTSEKLKGAQPGSNTKEGMKNFLQPVVDSWKALSPAELEHYNHLAHSRAETTAAEYKRWVESYTPEAIAAANRARSSLRRQLGAKVKGKSTWQPIRDERAVKRPASSYIQFSINRQSSGDFRNIPVTERSKLIAQEWKALNEGEKKKYKDLQTQDLTRYAEEFNSVYGHMPPGLAQPQAVAAAA